MITQERLLEKINALPQGKLQELSNFVDSLASRTDSLTEVERDQKIARYAVEFGGTEVDRAPSNDAAITYD